MTRLLIAAGALAFVLGAAGNAMAQSALPTVSLIAASADEDDDTIDFTVGVSQALGADLTLGVSYADGSVAVDDVLQRSRPGSVTISSGRTIATLEVPITDDLDIAEDGTFAVTIRFNSGPTVRITRATVTGTIRGEAPASNNNATVSIANASASEADDTIDFTVSLTEAVDSAVSLRVTVAAGSGNDPVTLADDLGTTRSSVTIARGDTSATITVPIIDDEDIEEDETFTVSIRSLRGPLPNGVTLGTATATGTIIDDDDSSAPPPVATNITLSIEDVDVAENVAGGNAVFTVTASAAVTSLVELEITYAGSGSNPVTLRRTSSSRADLGERPASVQIRPGATTATFAVPINDDNEAEEDETFTVTIGLDDDLPNVEISRAVAQGTIRNDDREIPLAMVSIADAEVAEGETASFAVFLDQELPATNENAVILNVRVDFGTASSQDLAPLYERSVRILGGQISATWEVDISDDGGYEGRETFTVTITEDTNNPLPPGVEIGDGTASGTIVDDDPEIPGAVVSVADAEAVEGADVVFTVFLDRPVRNDLLLDVAYAAAGSNPITLQNDLGPTRPRNVTIREGDTTATIRVPTINLRSDDPDFSTLDGAEEDETFTVTISNRVGVTIGDGVATGTILDNDGEIPSVRASAMVSIADKRVAENVPGGNAGFTVFLDRAVNSAVTLAVAYAGSGNNPATPADDLGTSLLTTVEIPANATSATLDVPIEDDGEAEGDETFTVTLSEISADPLPAGVEIGDGVATGTILDSDPEPVMVSIADRTVAENVPDGEAVFTVYLNQAVDSDVRLAVAYAGSGDDPATPGDDLSGPDTVTIVQGAVSARLEVSIIDDDIDEEDETFTVTISGPPAGVAIGDGEATGEIRDNFDTTAPSIPPVATPVTVSIAPRTVGEADGNAVFTATLSAAADSAVTLDVAVASGATNGATVSGAGADLGTLPPDAVTIPQGDTTATITVPIIDDDIDEENETFTVTLSANAAAPLPAGVVIPGGTAVATGTIEDDDGTDITVSVADAQASEGSGMITFRVTSSAPVPSEVTLSVSLEMSGDDPALVSGAEADLTIPPGGIQATIAANSTEGTFSVPIVDDDLEEMNETFTVELAPGPGGLPPGVVLPDEVEGPFGPRSVATATGTIIDDDSPPTVSIASRTVGEGDGNAVFTVTLSAAADSAVTLDVAVAAGSGNDPVTLAGAGADLGTLPPATVTIPQGSLTATITVPIVNDSDIEEDETFTVTITDDDGSLDGVVTIGSIGVTATGTITDDDSPAPPTSDITVSVADAEASEGSGMITFTVTSSAPVPSAVRLSGNLQMSGDDPALVPSEDGTPDGTPADLAIPDGGIQVTIAANSTVGTFSVPIVDDDLEEMNETFTVELAPVPGGLPPGVVLSDEVEGPFGPRSVARATGTIIDDDSSGSNSVLAEAREAGAGTALRRHAGRFDSLTGAVVRNRLDARATRRLSASENVGNGAAAAGGGLGETRWGAWIDGAWAGFDGKASGRQADVYGGVDYQAGDWLIGALIGYETADLDIGDATYRSDYTQLGVYGGARVSERLLFDGAATYGTATPDVTLAGRTSSYDANRLTVRGALTGDLGIGYGHGLKVQPRLGLLYSREQLDAFEGSDDGSATLKLGRFSAGPRLTWEFDGGQVAGGVHAQWDFLELDDGVGNRISGAADIGVNLDLTPNVILGVQGDIDGIGTSGDFGSLGGRIKLDVRF